MAAFWMVTLALIAFTWRAFTANNVELVHYPQYVPEGMALLALTLSPAESLAWIVLCACFDEGLRARDCRWDGSIFCRRLSPRSHLPRECG